jgi:hypothetical protein
MAGAFCYSHAPWMPSLVNLSAEGQTHRPYASMFWKFLAARPLFAFLQQLGGRTQSLPFSLALFSRNHNVIRV